MKNAEGKFLAAASLLLFDVAGVVEILLLVPTTVEVEGEEEPIPLVVVLVPVPFELESDTVYMKLIKENIVVVPAGSNVMFRLGEGPFMDRRMVWLTLGSRLAAEKRGEHANVLEGRTPSTFVELPSRVTV